MNEGLMFALVCAIIALVYGGVTAKWILGLPTGNDRMREIAAAIQDGARAYLNRQYTAIGIVGVLLLPPRLLITVLMQPCRSPSVVAQSPACWLLVSPCLALPVTT